jgi:ketosteroid isomerase-like protein
MMRWSKLMVVAVLGVSALANAIAAEPAKPVFTGVQEQVANVERAFAATMRARDHAAFSAFLSEEAIFSGGTQPLRGKAAVAAEWKKFFAKPEAPFSWEPDDVEVLASGTLAKTSGPVYAPNGKLIARFQSVWRLEAPNAWRIVFDGGTEVCDCKK